MLTERIAHHLDVLASRIGARPPGSPANRRATAHVAATFAAAGLDVRADPFTTRWWEPGPGELEVAGERRVVAPDPYSPPCDVRGRVVRVGDLAGLRALVPIVADPLDVRVPGPTILVLADELTREQLWPAAFPFLESPEHREVAAALLAARPVAIIAVTDHWEPILEDPDLGIPSTTIPSATGADLRDGVEVALRLGGEVHPGEGVNVAGRTGGPGRRLVLSAHVDSKATTPGAFDNAGGVAVLLALVEQGLPVGLPVEVVAFNGEDHVDACGEVAWLAATDLDEIAAIVNLDGAGVRGHGSALSLLGCPAEVEAAVTALVDGRPGWGLAAPWYQSDHAILAMRGIPAVAVTTAGVHDLLASLAHGPADTVEVVDVAVLADVAELVGEVLVVLADRLGVGPPPAAASPTAP
jgi:aminopeptidase YwaD